MGRHRSRWGGRQWRRGRAPAEVPDAPYRGVQPRLVLAPHAAAQPAGAQHRPVAPAAPVAPRPGRAGGRSDGDAHITEFANLRASRVRRGEWVAWFTADVE